MANVAKNTWAVWTSTGRTACHLRLRLTPRGAGRTPVGSPRAERLVDPRADRSRIVDAAWVRTHEGSVVLADVGGISTAGPGAAYEAAHLPGAVFVDIEADLSSPGHPTDGRHPLPAPEQFAGAMGRLGLAGRRRRRL